MQEILNGKKYTRALDEKSLGHKVTRYINL